MVCMQPEQCWTKLVSHSSESVWHDPSVQQGPTRLGPKSGGRQFALLDFYLKMGQNWSPWSEFFHLLYWFHSKKATEIKLQKHCYNDNSLGFLPTNFCTSSCQTCLKCGYYKLFKAEPASTSLAHTNKVMHAHTAQSNTQQAHGHKRPCSQSHHSLRKRILKVCFTKLERGGRIFSFSPSSRRCVFERA